MNENEFLLCFSPNVSFKQQLKLRGNKGVGATFLAYGFNAIYLHTKKENRLYAANLRQGRVWAEDTSGRVPRPRLDEKEFSIPELTEEKSGLHSKLS